MAFKETKRKGFNFFRSYYDVFNELTNDKDKLAFIEALLDRQFLGVKPTGLKGMAKFAWISQVNSIDSQVKGYEDKTKTTLNQKKNTPTDGGYTTPTEQVQEKVQVQGEEKVQDVLTEFSNSLKPFLVEYGKEMLNEFYLYWTEKGQRARKYRFEKEKTWELSRRLKRWSDNNFNTGSVKKQITPEAIKKHQQIIL